MLPPRDLPTVSMAELSREARRVMDRIMRGERLIVCRHRQPIATLQPLDGYVTQPWWGDAAKVDGSPLGNLEAELNELQPIEKKMLMDCVSRGRILITGLEDFEQSPGEVLYQWRLRGLARLVRGHGTFATARALVLREALLTRAGRPIDVVGLFPRFARDNPF